MKNVHALQENIFITSDEEIKDGDWCLDLMNNKIYVATKVVVHNLKSLEYEQYLKKIILTTDQDLIKDGIQAIDDEFLEWFVNNPSCEEVEVYRPIEKGIPLLGYKIIIPKEEAKQDEIDFIANELVIEKERSYSEEDMLEFSEWVSHNDWVYLPSKGYWVNEEAEESEEKLTTKELFNKFKNK